MVLHRARKAGFGNGFPQGFVRQIEFDFLNQVVRIQIDANLAADFVVPLQALDIVGKLEATRAIDFEVTGLELFDRFG